MKIYLGLSGNEILLCEWDRVFNYLLSEICDDVISENGSIFRYSTDIAKKVFNISYSFILRNDFISIETEYNRHTVLSLKIEEIPNSDIYLTYNVLFGEGIKIGYAGWREYKDVSFILKET